MLDFNMNRKEFLKSAGKCCLGSCACVLMGGLMSAHADDSTGKPPANAEKPRSEKRIEFAENWVTRFMDVLDETLDPETRRKIMMANGKKCYRAWIADTGRQIKPVTLEQLTEWVNKNVMDDSIRIDRNIIYFQFNSAAETGLPSEEGQCLCTLVETKPKGLSGTYCDCSVGYVKEWHELLLARQVEVELTESVLRGGKRCKFKITVL